MGEIKKFNPGVNIEVLSGDFAGCNSSLKKAVASFPEVFSHNIETVERLSPRVRDARADYKQSLLVLQNAKRWGHQTMMTKSALLLGLGESQEEVIVALEDLRNVDVDIITMGQYMRPTKKHLSIKEWVPPSQFKVYEIEAKRLGFKAVASHPLVRSSYKAEEVFRCAKEIKS